MLTKNDIADNEKVWVLWIAIFLFPLAIAGVMVMPTIQYLSGKSKLILIHKGSSNPELTHYFQSKEKAEQFLKSPYWNGARDKNGNKILTDINTINVGYSVPYHTWYSILWPYPVFLPVLFFMIRTLWWGIHQRTHSDRIEID